MLDRHLQFHLIASIYLRVTEKPKGDEREYRDSQSDEQLGLGSAWIAERYNGGYKNINLPKL